jgi:hypothetical protein
LALCELSFRRSAEEAKVFGKVVGQFE